MKKKTKNIPQKPSFCLTKSIATMLVTTLFTATWAQAAPQGATVVQGHATIHQKGDKFTIRPSDNAIINYSAFSIGVGEKVQFIQQSSSSRVLNRVTDPNPSHIFGTLQANGHVFLINPYGVYLENGSVLNVGSFTAAAGHLSDADFLSGKDHFTDLTGSVVNRGTITAQGDISLVGANVANFGTLVSAEGTVAMVSGTDVLIGKKDGNVFVNAAPAARKTSAGAVTAGVQNSGHVRAPRALLAAGDLYAVAISNTGIIQSRQTTLQGGANSTVHVSGTIDASNKAGKGGQVKITGGHIQMQGATVDASGSTGGGEILVGGDPVGRNLASLSSTIDMDAGSTLRASSTGGPGGRVVIAGSQAAGSTVHLSGLIDASSASGQGGQVTITGVHLTLQGLTADASGATGGGEILVGGDLHGQGATPTATTTSIDATSKLQADAKVQGNGGKVVVWSNQQTDYAGTLSAQGAGTGNGGQAEVSGKALLNYTGQAILTAPKGQIGTLLLDPDTITIATGGANTITGGLVAFGDTPTNSTISPATLVAALNTADITLQANIDISFTASVTSGAAHNLTLQAGHSIDFGSFTLSLGGNLTATAHDPGGTGFANANPVISSTGTISTTGSITLTNTGGAIQVAALTSGSSMALTGTAVTLSGAVSAGTTVSLTAGSGAVTESGGTIHGTTLTTSSSTGQTLTGANTVTGFNATNSSSGNIALANTATTLTVTGISQSGNGTTTVNNTGALTTTGTVTTTGTGTLTLQSTGTETIGAAVTASAGPATIALVSTGGNLALNANVNAGTGGVALAAISGTITQAGGKTVTAAALGIAATAVPTLTTGSSLSTLAADITGAGNAFSFAQASGFDIGTVGPISGLTTNNGAITLSAFSGNLTLSQNVNAGTAAVNLTASAGSITSTGGAVHGSTFTTSSSTGQALTGANTVTSYNATNSTSGNIALTNTAATLTVTGLSQAGSGTVTVNNTGALSTTGTVTTTGTGTLTLQSSGTETIGAAVTASAGPGTIVLTSTGGNLALNDNVNAGSGGVALSAPTGTITQAGGKTVTAGALGIAALSVPTLTTTGALSTLAANITGAGNAFSYSQAGSFTVGTVGPISGITTNNGVITLTASTGNLTISQAVNAGTAGVNLNSTSGTINENAAVSGSTAGLTAPTIALGASGTAVTTTGSQTYTGAVVLNADTVLSSGSGNITFTGTVNGAQALTANSTGTTLFSAAVGGTTALTSLTTNAGGTTTLTGNVTTSGAQSYGDNVTIAAVGSTLTTTSNGLVNFFGTTTLNGGLTVSTGSGNITFTGAVNGAQALTANSTGATLFSAAVGGTTALTSLTTNAGGTTTLTGNVTTSGAQNYGDNVTIATGSALTTANSLVSIGGTTTLNGGLTVSTGSGGITFTGAVNGAQALTANSTGTTLFSAAVGGTTALSSLTTDVGGTTTLTGNVTTSGTQSYGDNVTIAAGSTLTTTNSLVSIGGTTTLNGSLTVNTGSGNITFTGVVNGAQALTANSTGTTLFSSAVGGTTALTSLTTNAGGTTTLTGNVTTSGAQSYGDNVTIAAASTLSTANSAVTLSGTTTLNADLTVSSGTGNITFTGAVNGAHAVTADSTGTTLFSSTVGATTALTTVTTDAGGATTLTGSVSTTGAQSYGDNVTIGTGLTLTTTNSAVSIGGATTLNGGLTVSTGSGNITFTGTVDGAQALTANSTGTTLFSSAVGGTTAPASIITNAGGSTVIDANVNTSGTQNYGDNVTIGANVTLSTTNSAVNIGGATTLNGNLTVNTGTGGMAFTGAVDGAHALTANSTGTTLFSATVGGTTALTSLSTDAGGGTALAGNVTTTGAQSYGDNVTVAAASTLTTTNSAVTLSGTTTLGGDLTVSTGTGNITFTGAVNGAHALTANSTGTTLFSTAIGGTTALTSLTTDAGGGTTLTGNVTTSGGQSYGDAVTLILDSTLTSTGGAVSLAKVDGARSLTITASTGVTLGGAIGSTTALNLLNITSAAPITLGAGTVNSSGTQFYGGAITLTTDNTLTTTLGPITIFSTVNGAKNLAIHAATLAGLDGAIGSTTALTSLTVFGGTGFQMGAGTVKTTGNQTYSSAMTLLSATTLTSTGNGTISLAGVDGAQALSVSSAGTGQVTLTGAIGATTALASLSLTGGQSINLNGGTVRTTGNQTYTGPALLGATTALTSSGNGTISLATVNGAQALTVSSAGTGQVTLGAAIGGTTALTSLAVTGGSAINLNGGAVTTTGNQTYTGSLLLGTSTTLTSTANGTLTFGQINGVTNGGQSLTLNAGTGGSVVFGGPVGNVNRLASLTINGGTPLSLGQSITTTGSQLYTGEITLTADATLTSTTGSVTVAGVDGAHALTLSGNTGETLNGKIGSSTALTSFSTTGGAPITINSDLVQTTGGQTYTGPLTLGFAGTTSLTSTSNGTLTFAAIDASAAGHGLTVSSGATGSIIFNGTVGGTTPLAALTVTGGAPIALNGGTITTDGAQAYTGNITLGAGTTLTSNNAGLSLGKVDGANALALSAATTVTLGGEIGSTTRIGFFSMTTPAIAINTDLIHTSGGQSFNGGITLGTTATLDNSSGGFFFRAIDATTDGGQGLTVSGSGNASFAAAIGGTHRLASFTLGSGIPAQLFGNVSTTGNQTFSSDVTLANALTLNSNAGAIALQKVDGAAAFTVSGATGVTFNAEIGSITPLTSLNVSAPGHTITLHTDLVKTTGAQTYNNAMVLSQNTTLNGGPVTLAAVDATTAGGQSLTVTATGTTTFNGIVGGTAALSSLNVNGTGGVAIAASAIHTTGAQAYSGVTTLGATSTLSSTGGGAIQFLSTVDALTTGGEGLTLDTTGTVTFAQAVGQLHALQNLELTNPAGTLAVNGGFLTVTGDATFDGAVQAGANALTIQAGTLAFHGPVSGTSTLTLLGSANATGILVAGGSGFTPGPLAGAAPLILSVATLGEIQAGFSHLFIGSTTGSLPIDAGSFSLPANTTLRSGTGAIAVSGIQSDGTARTLDIDTTGLTTFVGSVGDARALAALDVSGAAAINAPAITTTGLQTYGGDVTVGATSTLTTTNSNVLFSGTTVLASALTVSAGTGNITFTGAVNGPADLTANSTGATTFGSTAGATTALASLTTDAGGATVLNGNMTTSGAQTYGDNVTLDAASTLTSTAGTISLQKVDGAFAFAVSGATGVTLNGQIGSATPLASFTAAAPGHAITLNASLVQTTGAQTYSDALLLSGITTLQSGGAVSFAAVDSTTVGVGLLFVTATGTTTFHGVVGGTAALQDLEVNGTGAIAIDTTAITTTDSQTYVGPATLGATTTLTGGVVIFASTLDDVTSGAHGLTIQTIGGTVDFVGSVGAATPLATVTVTGLGGTLAGGLTVGAGSGTTFTMATTGAVNLNTPLSDDASTTEFDVQSLTVAGKLNRTVIAPPNMTDSFTVKTSGDIQLLGDAFTPIAGGNGAIGILALTSTGGNVTVQSLTALQTASLQGAELILGQPAPSASSTTITLDGGQTLLLNDVPNPSNSGDATILHSPASSLVLTASQEIDLGAGQRLDAASGLAQLNALHIPIAATGVTVTAPKVVLGDLATVGSLTITSADLELLGRAPVPNAPAIEQGTTDLGLSLIATSVHLSSTPTFVPGTPPDEQKVYIAAGSISGFVPSASVIFVADGNVVNELTAFDAAHPGLQPTVGVLPSAAVVTSGPGASPAPRKHPAAVPLNFLIDDASILALLNDPGRNWFDLIGVDASGFYDPFNVFRADSTDDNSSLTDDDRRRIRYRRRLVLSQALLTQPDYPLLVSPHH